MVSNLAKQREYAHAKKRRKEQEQGTRAQGRWKGEKGPVHLRSRTPEANGSCVYICATADQPAKNKREREG